MRPLAIPTALCLLGLGPALGACAVAADPASDDLRAALAGKADDGLADRICADHGKAAGCDVCAADVLDYYGDDHCDAFCASPDPACPTPDRDACGDLDGFIYDCTADSGDPDLAPCVPAPLDEGYDLARACCADDYDWCDAVRNPTPSDCDAIDDGVAACVELDGRAVSECVPAAGDVRLGTARTCCDGTFLEAWSFCEHLAADRAAGP